MGNLIATGLDAPIRLANALERGEHVGMLVDQHFVQGRRCRVLRPLGQGKSADRAACAPYRRPIRGVRVVRRPDGNSFWGE